jgi:hypothetical protein
MESIGDPENRATQIVSDGPAAGRGCLLQKRTAAHFVNYCRGLISDLPRKTVEPIALESGTAVRTLQEFLTTARWDHQNMRDLLQRYLADRRRKSESCFHAFGAVISSLDVSTAFSRAFVARSSGLPSATCGNACYGLCAFVGLYPFMGNHFVTV